MAPFDSLSVTTPTAGALSKFEALSGLIGNTPLLGIKMLYRGVAIEVFAKAEQYNLSGSIKDRMALGILKNAYAVGALKPGQTIVEATSGNAGISFAALGAALGHPVKIFMPNWMSAERKALIKSYGAVIVDVTKEEGGFLGSIAMAEEAGKSEDVFLPRQFANQDNCNAHCGSTGPEIIRQLNTMGISPTAFVAGVGTGGTIMGAGQHLSEHVEGVKIHPLEPAESPTLSTGHKVGHHRMQGISDEFIPEIIDLSVLDEIICVNDGDAILMAQKLSRELGLGVGISAGGNIVGALKLIDKYGPQSSIVTILCDDNKKYLTTDLSKQEPMQEHYLSQHVSLLEYQTIC